MTNIEKTTFWSFLTSFSICIPIIQRDYAQGRIGKEELRKRFITSLREAISERKALPLDFTYGKFSGTGENKTFYPLDGQQRLTTLWLLHWYVAYKAKKLQDAKAILQKFSYATRVSARDFCKRLCELPTLPEGTSDILMHIQNQNWFYSSWNQDPTIQSMLRMISDTDKRTGIVELLELTNYEDSWNWLIKDCKMKFRILNIVEIGQTDDLYVKMNARGKALTSFENFKAELVDYIHKRALVSANADQAAWKKLDKPEDGFGQKLDNAWTDIFWKLRSKDDSKIQEHQNHIDEIFFAFFNRFFFNCQALHADSEHWKDYHLYGNSGKDEKIVFSTLKNYSIPPCCESVNIIPLEVFEQISTVLNNWKKLAIAIKDENPPLGPSWDKNSFFFLPVYEKEKEKLSTIVDDNGNAVLKITNVTVKQRAVFFAVCQWLLHNEPSADCHDYSQAQKDHFQDWLRVIWNIVENSTPDLKDLLTFIHIFLLPGCHDILKYLANLSVTCDSGKYVVMSNAESQETNFETAAVQLKEECEKAVQIMGWRGNHGMIDGTWYYRIKEAEKHPLLHGNICSILWEKNTSLEDWTTIVNQFYKFLPLKSHGNINLEITGDEFVKCGCDLLKFGDYSVSDGHNNWIFGSNRECWENLLHAAKNQTKDRVHPVLMKLLTNGVQKIYEKKDWQFYFIQYPEFFLKGCHRYRWYDDHFQIKKMTGNTLGAWNCNPFLEAIAIDNSKFSFKVASSDSGKIHINGDNVVMWIENNNTGIHFCVQYNQNPQKISSKDLDLDKDVVEQGRALLKRLCDEENSHTSVEEDDKGDQA